MSSLSNATREPQTRTAKCPHSAPFSAKIEALAPLPSEDALEQHVSPRGLGEITVTMQMGQPQVASQRPFPKPVQNICRVLQAQIILFWLQSSLSTSFSKASFN